VLTWPLLAEGERFGFLGFEYRRVRSRNGTWRTHFVPKPKKRTALLRKLKEIFRRYVSQPVGRVIELINPVLRGWVHYFGVGHSSQCFSYIKLWVEKKVRRFGDIGCAPESKKDSAGSGGVRKGSTTHSVCLTTIGWYVEPSAESHPAGIGSIP
jgi:hypothetical protein